MNYASKLQINFPSHFCPTVFTQQNQYLTCPCLCFGHLSEEQQRIVGEGFVVIGAQLHEAHSLALSIVQVFGKGPQLFILCGLESHNMSWFLPPSTFG